MTDDETVGVMLATFDDIKREQGETPTESVGTVKDGDCYACGSDEIRREIVSGHGANRTKNRHVGVQNMRVRKRCRDCGHTWF